ncbi:MAG: Stk1 family PASTA domain-containing Ser/Thr kinase [Firmicutes bacterium]|nr:Stk1 family PASTA domain-containing Ser/Thr kinase [Bacillota bacterium]
MDKYVGKRLDDRYDIREVIGVGGMAIVYKAYDRVEDRIVSIKILRDEYLGNQECLRRFRNESRAIAMLSHPNIVKVYDVSFGDRLQYIVMEYIDGITLKEYISQQHVIRWKEAVHFTLQILYALQHAHEKGIIHRDIKPQNIMLLKDGTIKVTDFGIARFSRSDSRTMTDKAIGSVHYIAPEQARGAVTDEKSDVYSVGVMLYEMLTGKLPFEAESAVSVAIMQMQSEAKPPRSINPEIPEGLEEITLKAMKKDPEQRYASAAEMIRDINAFRQDPSIRFQYRYFIDEKPTKYLEAIDRVKGDPSAETDGAVDLIEQRKKATAIPVITGVVSALLLFAIVFGVFLFFKDLPTQKEDEEIFLPDFTGQMLPDVQEQYQDSFNFIVEYDVYENAEIDRIMKQEPAGNVKKVKKGSNVTLYVNHSGEQVQVPETLIGMQVSEAIALLSEQKLSSTIVQVFSDDTASGYVVEISPAGGSTVRVNTKITLFVSKGAEEKNVVVGNYLGKSFEDAKNEILKNNLKVSTPRVVDSDRPKNEVIGQDPAYGTSLNEGESVELTISSGNPPAPVENTVAFDVTLPKKTVSASLALTVWANGEQVESQNKNLDPSLTGSTTITLVGTDTDVNVMVRLNGKDYQQWSVNFQEKTASLVRDYGYIEDVSSLPPSSEPPEESESSESSENSD